MLQNRNICGAPNLPTLSSVLGYYFSVVVIRFFDGMRDFFTLRPIADHFRNSDVAQQGANCSFLFGALHQLYLLDDVFD
jgi:hypothetical protein